MFVLGASEWVFGTCESIKVTLATHVIYWMRLFDIPSVSVCL